MNIVGLNAYHGDVSAVLLGPQGLVCAVEEERFRRVKHWAGIPELALRSCLEVGNLRPEDVDHFAVSRDPRAHLLRKIAFAATRRPGRGLVSDRLKNQSRVQKLPDVIAEKIGLDATHVRERMHWVEHHPAHLASSFFASPFDDATVVAIDGFGDFVSTSVAQGCGTRLAVKDHVFFPHSLGLMYTAVTQFLGFPRYGDEFKVMGLAPYGSPDYVKQLRQLVHLTPDGRFELDLSYFCHHTDGVSMTWDDGEPTLGGVFTPKLSELLGPQRQANEPLQARHEAIAHSLQVVFEDAVVHVLRHAFKRTRNPRLCLAGGCAMNSVMNGKVRERTPFTDIYIQPASGDNGTALGAALYVKHHILGDPRDFQMTHGYWGPEFSRSASQSALDARRNDLQSKGCSIRAIDDVNELCRWTAERVAQAKIVGWYQGRMEWGARALGNRSIVADPRRADMRTIINTKIKFREKFRPFAPSILEEALDDYFVGAVPDPFMIQVYPVQPAKRDVIPAVTHVDGSGRLQTVSRDSNPLYWSLISAFRDITGVPVVLNTSFNENEPIVLKPEEALDCFLRTDMDVLVLGSLTVEKPSDRSGPAR